REALVPPVGEVEPSFLHPAIEVRRGDAVRRGQRGMLGGEDPHRGVLVRHAIARERQLDRGKPIIAQVVQRVVLRHHGAARLHIGEQRGQLRGQILPHVERADADDNRVEAAEPFLRQVGAGQRPHLVSHLLQRGRHVVTGARQVANLVAASRQLERYGLGAGGGLEKLEWQVLVANCHALLVEAATVDQDARAEGRGGGRGGGGYREGEARVLARRREAKRLCRRRDGPPGGCVELQRA